MLLFTSAGACPHLEWQQLKQMPLLAHLIMSEAGPGWTLQVFHRLLCHKSFTTPKWLEYLMAYVGSLNIQVCSWYSETGFMCQCCTTVVALLRKLQVAWQPFQDSAVCCVQGDPIEWVSDHRYHHQHTDTPMDPHSPYEGFWWSHIGWLWDNEVPRLPIRCM